MANVRYEAAYDGSEEPRIYKVVEIDSDESNNILTAIFLQNVEELENVSNEILWQHIENLVSYFKVETDKLSITAIGIYSDDGWPLSGWSSLEKLNQKINEWWYFLSRRDEVAISGS